MLCVDDVACGVVWLSGFVLVESCGRTGRASCETSWGRAAKPRQDRAALARNMVKSALIMNARRLGEAIAAKCWLLPRSCRIRADTYVPTS